MKKQFKNILFRKSNQGAIDWKELDLDPNETIIFPVNAKQWNFIQDEFEKGLKDENFIS